MVSEEITRGRDMLRRLVAEAKKAGATDAAATLHLSREAGAGVRNGTVEQATMSSSFQVGLRVFIGSRSALTYANDMHLDPAITASQAVEAARYVPEDPFLELVPSSLLAPAQPISVLNDYHQSLPDAKTLIHQALQAEEAALQAQGITNSEGSEAQADTSLYALCRADGYENAYARTSHGLSACVIAGGDAAGTSMERDYAYTSAVKKEYLLSPEAIGREASERTLRRMHGKKADTGTYTLIFEPRMAKSLLGHALSAMNGASVVRGASFMKDMIGQIIFPSHISILHRPLLRDGLQSKPFDAEGVLTQDLALVEDGILQHFLLDHRSAKKLGHISNGCASGGLSPSPSSCNAILQGGNGTIDDMIASTEKGILVTDGFGGGVNIVTGDYSQGISGLLIEKGVISGAVHEITAAGKLQDMFHRLHAAADTEYRYASNAPALMIEDMAVAGV